MCRNLGWRTGAHQCSGPAARCTLGAGRDAQPCRPSADCGSGRPRFGSIAASQPRGDANERAARNGALVPAGAGYSAMVRASPAAARLCCAHHVPGLSKEAAVRAAWQARLPRHSPELLSPTFLLSPAGTRRRTVATTCRWTWPHRWSSPTQGPPDDLSVPGPRGARRAVLAASIKAGVEARGWLNLLGGVGDQQGRRPGSDWSTARRDHLPIAYVPRLSRLLPGPRPWPIAPAWGVYPAHPPNTTPTLATVNPALCWARSPASDFSECLCMWWTPALRACPRPAAPGLQSGPTSDVADLHIPLHARPKPPARRFQKCAAISPGFLDPWPPLLALIGCGRARPRFPPRKVPDFVSTWPGLFSQGPVVCGDKPLPQARLLLEKRSGCGWKPRLSTRRSSTCANSLIATRGGLDLAAIERGAGAP